MKIAILGWGSLIRCPKDLATKGDWKSDGPELPIEFARISSGDRLTLVLYKEADPLTTYWIRSSMRTLEGARENLRCREGCPKIDSIGYLTRKGRKRIMPFPEIEEPIRSWLIRRRELDAVIWTGLASNFHKKIKKDFSVDQGVEWLRELVKQSKHAKAEEYVRSAPPQTNTRLREQSRVLLGWTDLIACGKC